MDRIEEVGSILTKVGTDKKEAFDSFMQFANVVKESKSLDLKTKELILVALAVSSHCEWCIAAHVAGAVEAGASKDEILDSCMLTVVMGGGPNMMHMGIVYEELEKHFK